MVAHDGNTDGWPATCSERCKKRAVAARYRARQVARQGRLCWGCWKGTTVKGRLCRPCLCSALRSAEAMCHGKQRIGQQAAVDRATLFSMTHGSEMQAYGCPICRWWHTGHRGFAALRKPRSLMAELYAASLSEEELTRLRRDWSPR